MQDDVDFIVFSIVLCLLILAIGISVYVVLQRMKQNAIKAAALTAEQARARYAVNMPKKPLLYSVLINNEHLIKDETDTQVARITFPIAKGRLFRVITIGTQPYECHLETGLTNDKAHLYQTGYTPDTAKPMLTFEPKFKTEFYFHQDTERYRRNIYDRKPGTGWTIYSHNNQPVAYLENLYHSLKVTAFLLHPVQDMPLIEQLFIIAMSDKNAGRA